MIVAAEAGDAKTAAISRGAFMIRGEYQDRDIYENQKMFTCGQQMGGRLPAMENFARS